jgi:hypothetical protein
MPRSPFSVDVMDIFVASPATARCELVEEVYEPQIFGGDTRIVLRADDLLIECGYDRGKLDALVKVSNTKDEKWYGLPYLFGFFEDLSVIDDLIESISFEHLRWLAENYLKIHALLRDPTMAATKSKFDDYVSATFADYRTRVREKSIQHR